MSSKQDFASMKKLLTLWNVEILYELFKEEDITIEEMKIIKLHHLPYLLKNYKMGLKIRFEHHFENWRNQIGKPLRNDEQNPLICSCHSKTNGPTIETNNVNKPMQINTVASEIPTDHLELDYRDPSPESSPLINSYNQQQKPNETRCLTPTPILRSSSRKKNHEIEDQLQENPIENETLATLTDLLTTSLGADGGGGGEGCSDDESPPQQEITPIFPSTFKSDRCPVTLSQILHLAGSRGMALVKYYAEHKRLTNTQRTQLILTIVEFFDDNDYHLSLNMSHNLEWQILKMFPTEKLEYYRTEKRGKIYVKFSNMKRYKRERNKVKPEIEKRERRSNHIISEEHTITDQGTNYNMDTTSYDTWPEGAESQMEIKPEMLSDEG